MADQSPPPRRSPMRALRARWARQMTTLVENSVYGMAITVVNSATGFVFWIAAARFYSARDVGIATALIAAMTLASTVSNLGVGSALVERLPTRPSSQDWSVTLNASLVASILSGVAAALVTVAVLPLVAEDLAVVRTSPGYALVLSASIVLWTLSTTMDFLFVAERKVKYGFARNAAFSVWKLLILLAFAAVLAATPLALFGTWALGSALALVSAVQLARRRLSRRWTRAVTGMRHEARSMMSSLVGHHFINLGGYLPMYLLPLIVTARLGAVPNAWAYIGWTVGSFALVVSPTVAASLFAEGSHNPAAFAHQVKSSFGIIAALLLPLVLIVVVFGRPILEAFGSQYAQHSYGLLVVLALSAIPDAVTNVYVTTLRVRGNLSEAATINVAMALGAVAMAWFLVRPLGVSGIAWSWLIAQSVGAGYVAVRVLLTPSRRNPRTPDPGSYPPRSAATMPTDPPEL